MSEDYYIRLNADYVLGLFQAEVDKYTAGKRLERWSDVIMDWYEDQLENNEFDWGGIDIPSLVQDDIEFHEMCIITRDDPEYDEVDSLHEEWGCTSVDEYTNKVARILYQGYDNDGNIVYLCQKVL